MVCRNALFPRCFRVDHALRAHMPIELGQPGFRVLYID